MEVAPSYTLLTQLKLLYTAFKTEACMPIVRKGLQRYWMWLMSV